MSRTTHVDPRCVLSCCVCTALIRGIIRGEVRTEGGVDELVREAYEWVGRQEELLNPRVDDTSIMPESSSGGLLDLKEFERHVHAKTLVELQLDDSMAMGYVYKCLGAAILTLRFGMRRAYQPPSMNNAFELLITDLVLCGGDGDTNAAVAGALLGSFVGYSRLPSHWANGMANREWLVRKTERLSRITRISESVRPMEEEEDSDTAPDGGRGLLDQAQLDQRESGLIRRILEKQQERREVAERERERAKSGMGKWFKGLAWGSDGK
jgi:ADP-ribosylglycohydrolase